MLNSNFPLYLTYTTMKLSYLKTIFVAAAVSAMSVNAPADEMYWRYLYGSRDDNGRNASNWRDAEGNKLNRVPTKDDNLIFDSYDPVEEDGGTQVSNRMHTQGFELNVASILLDFDSTKASPSNSSFAIVAVNNANNNFTVTGGLTVRGDKNIVFRPDNLNALTTHAWKSIDLGYVSIENSRTLQFENTCALIKLNAIYNETKQQWETISDMFVNEIGEGSSITIQGKQFENADQQVKAVMGSTNNYGNINIWANTEFIAAGNNFNNYGTITVIQNSQYAGNQALSGVINNKSTGTIAIDNNTGDNTINAVINNEGTIGSNTNAGKMVFTNGSKINNIGGYINLNGAGIDFQEGSSLYSKTASRVVFNAKTNAAHFSDFEVYGSGEKNTTIDKGARYVDIYGTNVSFDNLTIGGGFSRYAKDVEGDANAKGVDHLFYVSDSGAFSAKNITILTNLVSSENEANGITDNYAQIRSNGGPATIENLTFQGGESADAKTYRVGEFRINTGKKDYGDDYALVIDKINVLGYAKQSHWLSTFSTVSAKIGVLNIEDGISVSDGGIGAENFTGTKLLVEKVTGNVRTANSSEVSGHQGITVNDISLTNAINGAGVVYFNVRGTKSVEIDTVNAVVKNSAGYGGELYAWTEVNTTVGEAGAVHIKNVNLDAGTRLHIGSVGTSELNGYTGYSHLDNVNLGNGGVLEFAFKDTGADGAIVEKTANIGNLNGYGTIKLDGNSDWITYTLNLNGSGKYTGSISDESGKAAQVVNIVKNGTGTQVLGGNNTYKGTTTVNEGTLLMNRTDGNTTITVKSGAFLGAAGNGLNVANIVKESGASFMFDFSMGSDVSINLTDGSKLSGEILSTDFVFCNIAGILNMETLLFSFTEEENITNAFLKEILDSGATYTYIDKATGDQYIAKFTEGDADGCMYVTFEVPEPATWAAIFGALALALAIYRRRK